MESATLSVAGMSQQRSYVGASVLAAGLQSYLGRTPAIEMRLLTSVPTGARSDDDAGGTIAASRGHSKPCARPLGGFTRRLNATAAAKARSAKFEYPRQRTGMQEHVGARRRYPGGGGILRQYYCCEWSNWLTFAICSLPMARAPLAKGLNASLYSTASSTISARRCRPVTCTRATLTGSLKRRGPALPGFKYKTPSRVSIAG